MEKKRAWWKTYDDAYIARGLRVCSKCKIEQPFDQYRKEKRTKVGRVLRCISCEKKYHKIKTKLDWAKNKNDPEFLDKKKAHDRKYCQSIRGTLQERFYHMAGKFRERMRGKATLTLTLPQLEDLWNEYGGLCAYCTKPAILPNGSPSFDHVIPVAKEGNHSKENLVPSCWDCNYAKRDRHQVPKTPEEVKNFQI